MADCSAADRERTGDCPARTDRVKPGLTFRCGAGILSTRYGSGVRLNWEDIVCCIAELPSKYWVPVRRGGVVVGRCRRPVETPHELRIETRPGMPDLIGGCFPTAMPDEPLRPDAGLRVSGWDGTALTWRHTPMRRRMWSITNPEQPGVGYSVMVTSSAHENRSGPAPGRVRGKPPC